VPLGFAYCILSFANGDIENLLSKLGGIARTFGHETSMPQAGPTFYRAKFQTEALPHFCGQIPPSDGQTFNNPTLALPSNFLAGLHCGYTGIGTVPQVAPSK
jgi:hypothetical protein